MILSITLPNELVNQLQRKAQEEQRSIQDVALDLLEQALQEDEFPTPEEVIARAKATPPNPLSIRPAQGSLADLLRNALPDPNFDQAAWDRDWAAVEAEMKAITRANDLAEGRL